ncbi:MAG: SDR family oxidoreductase [Nonlabens sp.]|nr:SDR family oxidoreductase [Nonlabens sp.]
MKIKERIVITGAAGFIGSHLCDYFVDNDYEVVGLDNFATGFKKNIAHIRSKPNFSFMEGDIRDLNVCKQAISGADYVLHQAALGSVPRSISDPMQTNEVNISGFLNVLIASHEAGVKKVVYAASSSTYGSSEQLPKVEETIGKPLSPYAITKYVNELYADVFFNTYGLNTIGLRYFNVFGPRQDANGAYAAVIPKFVKGLMTEGIITLNGDGSYSRDFTYIENVVQANVKALLATSDHANNTVFNVACGDRTTLNELLEILKELLEHHHIKVDDVTIIHGPLRPGDVPHSQASIEKAKDLLNYFPEYNVRQGLEKSVAWYIENL